MSPARNHLTPPNLPAAETSSASAQNSKTRTQRSDLHDRILGTAALISDNPQWVAWVGLLLALLLLLMRLGFADQPGIGMWISSDTLYPVNVFTDVLNDGYAFSGWRFSIAPCWFPDLGATGLFWLVTQNVILATLLAGFIQVPGIVGAFHLIGKAIGIRCLRLQDTLLLGASVAVTVYVAFHTGAYYPGLRQLFLPQSHIGNMLLVLYGWAMALQMVRWQLDGISIPRWFILLYSVLCFLAGMSNLLFLVHMLLPLTVAFLALQYFTLIRAHQWWLSVVCGYVAAFAGAAVNRFVLPVTGVSAQSDMSFNGVLTSADVFLRGFAQMVCRADPLHVAAIAWASLSVAYILWFLRQLVVDGRSHARKSQILMATFFLSSLISGISSVAAIVLGGSNGLSIFKDYVWSMHYLHQAFFLPLFALPAAIVWGIEAVVDDRAVRLASIVSAIVPAVVVLTVLMASQRPVTPVSAYQPPLVRALDPIASEKGLRFGYAGYWQARLITLLSHSGVRAAAVDGNLNPFLWVSNEQWYRQAFDDRTRRPHVDFVVLDDPIWKISRETVVRTFGEPGSEMQVGGTRVLFYTLRQ